MKSKQRHGTKMKVVQRNLDDFIHYVEDKHLRISADVTIFDRKHRLYSGVLKCGSYGEFDELCRISGITLSQYTWLG